MFDQNLSEDYLSKVQKLYADVKNKIDPKFVKCLRTENNNPFAVLISLDEPLFLILSHPISRFLKTCKYFLRYTK